MKFFKFFVLGMATWSALQSVEFPTSTQSSVPNIAIQTPDPAAESIHYDLSVYNGYITGISKSIVYSYSGGKDLLSQLDWKLHNVLICGVKASLSKAKIHITFNGWMQAVSGCATMIDRDWTDPDQYNRLTHISWSPSELMRAHEVSAQIGYDVYQQKVKVNRLTIQSLAGWKYLDLYWESWGGIYHYENQRGFFPNGLGISFRQRFVVPYVGMQFEWLWNNKFRLNLFNKYSPSAYIASRDFHALRSTYFDHTFQDGQFWMVGGEFGWNFLSHMKLNLDYTFDLLTTTRGDDFIYNLEDASTCIYPNGVGLYHNHHKFILDLSRSF